MNVSQRRIVGIGAAIVALALVVVAHLAWVMLVQHEAWAARSSKNRWAFRDIPSRRGSILDRDGQVLAQDVPSWSLWCDARSFLQGHPVGQALHCLALIGRTPPDAPDEAIRQALRLSPREIAQAEVESAWRKLARARARSLVIALAGARAQDAARAWSQARTDQAFLELCRGDVEARIGEVTAMLERARASIVAAGGEDLVAIAREKALSHAQGPRRQRLLARRITFDMAAQLACDREALPGVLGLPSVERVRGMPDGSPLASLASVLGTVAPYGGSLDPEDPARDEAMRNAERVAAEFEEIDASDDEELSDEQQGVVSDRVRSALASHFRHFGRFGRSGIERDCDALLIGRPGLRWIEKNKKFEEQSLHASLDVTPGADVRLTIDSRLQLVLEAAAERMAASGICHQLGAALLDAESGEVLALAGRPLVDAKGGERFTTSALVWEGTGFLGSVAKPFVALEQLDAVRNGRPHKDTQSFVPCAHRYGKPKTGGKTLFCDGTHGEDSRDVETALAKSCNVYFFEAATGLGWEGLQRAFQRVGLARGEVAEPRVAGLGGEGASRFVRAGFALEQNAVGYGIEANALRVARAYAALGTGRLMPLTLLRDAERREGTPLDIDPDDLARVRTGLLRCCMDGGTAWQNRDPAAPQRQLAPLGVAGKTGTAEISTLTKENNAWFAGWLPPAESGCRLAFAVVLYRVPDEEHGGESPARFIAELLVTIARDEQLARRYLPPRSGR